MILLSLLCHSLFFFSLLSIFANFFNFKYSFYNFLFSSDSSLCLCGTGGGRIKKREVKTSKIRTPFRLPNAGSSAAIWCLFLDKEKLSHLGGSNFSLPPVPSKWISFSLRLNYCSSSSNPWSVKTLASKSLAPKEYSQLNSNSQTETL